MVLGDEGGGVCGADPAAHVRAGERAHGGCRSGLHRFVGVLQRVLQEVKVHARLRLRGRARLPEAAGLRGVLRARLLPGEQRQLQEGDGGDQQARGVPDDLPLGARPQPPALDLAHDVGDRLRRGGGERGLAAVQDLGVGAARVVLRDGVQRGGERQQRPMASEEVGGAGVVDQGVQYIFNEYCM